MNEQTTILIGIGIAFIAFERMSAFIKSLRTNGTSTIHIILVEKLTELIELMKEQQIRQDEARKIK